MLIVVVVVLYLVVGYAVCHKVPYVSDAPVFDRLRFMVFWFPLMLGNSLWRLVKKLNILRK